MGFLTNKYFNWLQKDAPAGEVEKYPLINDNGETSVKGIYVAGDLTGIPLLKLAAESGKERVDFLLNNQAFLKEKERNKNPDVYDFIIIGAGPAGISAGIEAAKKKCKFLILESTKKFSTILNFPKGKPIFAEPVELAQKSDLKINDGTKESLLTQLNEQLIDIDLPIEEGAAVEEITKSNGYFEIKTNKGIYKALRVILAIGKSGNSRTLNVPGENLPKVFNRLFDPADTKGHDVLVVGGGDSALETAIAAAEYANSVVISYRKSNFSRPNERNISKLEELAAAGKIKKLTGTAVKEITNDSVILIDSDGREISIKNSLVYVLIGKELPVEFFKRSGIKLEGEWDVQSKLQFALLLLFSGLLYFGKSSASFLNKFADLKVNSFGDLITAFFSPLFWSKIFTLPADLLGALFSDKVRLWSASKYINAIVAYISFVAFVFLGIYVLYIFIKERYKDFGRNWQTFKYTYFILIGIFFLFIFFGGRYLGYDFLGKSQGFWYTAIYSLTIVIFGLRRIHVKPTRYIKYQTWSLMGVQVFFLFLLPEFIFPYLGSIGALGAKEGFIMTQVFPGNSYWRSYGFILAWPLNFSNLYNSHITTFWLVFSIVQTFVVIPYIVYRWGKGAYCGWICSCGGLAETLGDEYRTLAPHGSKAKQWENIGQWILSFAFLITLFKLIGIVYKIEIPIINESINYTSDFLHIFYYIAIDVIFAGVLGLGVYFFMSGRIWCRFGCPLAALMHIYSKFSRYRIFSDKKKCISCNICTKVCHMGIDVMNYANKGIPMNDVQCVRCSACVVNCPTEVLSFGSLPKSDVDNNFYKKIELPIINNEGWTVRK